MSTKIVYVKAKRTKIFDDEDSVLHISEPKTKIFDNIKDAFEFVIDYLSEPRVTKTEKVATVDIDSNDNITINFDIIDKSKD